ncbi:phage integrase SAM-like domain-containing protein [uncultured Duncaniella sp.]|uniref:phage integrase SAM-like domain-containing protein n=1 Tax=uncultured Duncaniella sp. TaxID=2768039 RepID=UPI00339D32D2
MYTINIRGRQNPKDQKMVKLEMIFFKTGYARVPKVLNVTGLLKDWDVKSQSFRVGSAEATTKNKLLFDLRTKYLHMADTWEAEERNWSPVQLAHCFDEIKTVQSEVKVKSVQQMFEFLMEKFRDKKKIKNGQIVDSTNNAQHYVYLLHVMQQFTKEKYNRSFSSYFFSDITEQFLLDFSFWIKAQGIKNGNKAGLTNKLRRLRAVCNYAKKQEMYGVNMDAFLCLGDDIKWPETTSKAVSDKTIEKIANIDRTLFSKKEQLHLDLFLFSYYTGGMANVDVCNLTWDLVQKDRIVYERIKFPKTAKPILLKKAKDIMNKYKGTGYENYVFPVFTHKHTTTTKKSSRVKQLSMSLSKTLAKACRMLRIKEKMTWYSARGSFISKMVDAGNNPYVIAEMAGNSPLTIYKHYYKNTKRDEIKNQMEQMF